MPRELEPEPELPVKASAISTSPSAISTSPAEGLALRPLMRSFFVGLALAFRFATMTSADGVGRRLPTAACSRPRNVVAFVSRRNGEFRHRRGSIGRAIL